MKRYPMLAGLVALIAWVLLPAQSASGGYAVSTVRKQMQQARFADAIDAFNERGPDAYEELLQTFQSLMREDLIDVSEDCAKHVLYIQSWLGLDQAAYGFAAFGAGEYPRAGELAEALFAALQWEDAKNAGAQGNPFAPLASILATQKEPEIIALLTANQDGSTMAEKEREAFDGAWQTLERAFAGFAYLAASDFPYAVPMLFRLSPLLMAFDNASLLSEGEALMPDFSAAASGHEDIVNNAPQYGGGK